jgi:dihydropteroate synthase
MQNNNSSADCPEAFLVEPLALSSGDAARELIAAGLALPLANGPVGFSLARLIPNGAIVPVSAIPPAYLETLARLTAAPAPWAGLTGSRPWIMGVLNVTPDSFSDGGDFNDPARAIQAGMDMVHAGADIIDIGGETTRPGSLATPPDVEQARVIPAVRALAGHGITVSVDTRNASTMQAALAAGARIVNDVSALTHDPAAARVVARAGCPVVLMHMRHDPATMTALAHYDDVALEVTRELAARVAAAEAAGIARANIAIDPGIGFAKTPEHNLQMLGRLALLANLGCPVLLGVSRKGFIGRLSGETDPRRRAAGSIAAALFGLNQGVALLRVHDVAETIQAVRVWRGLAQHS